MLASLLPGIGDSSKEEGDEEVASEVPGDGNSGADWNDEAGGPASDRTSTSEAHTGNEPEDVAGTGAVGTCAVSTGFMAVVHSSSWPLDKPNEVSGCTDSWTQGRSTGSEVGVNNGETREDQVSSGKEARAEVEGDASAEAGDA